MPNNLVGYCLKHTHFSKNYTCVDAMVSQLITAKDVKGAEAGTAHTMRICSSHFTAWKILV